MNLISEDGAANAGGLKPRDRHLTGSPCLSEVLLMGALGHWEAWYMHFSQQSRLLALENIAF